MESSQSLQEYGKIISWLWWFGRVVISEVKKFLEQNLTNDAILEIIKNHTVFYSLKIFKELDWNSWEYKTKIILEIERWIKPWLEIKNYSVFFLFCKIHGFIPVLSKIEIDWKELSEVKNLYPLFQYFKQAFLAWDYIVWWVYWEIEKLTRLLDDLWMSWYNAHEILHLLEMSLKARSLWYHQTIRDFWKKLQRMKNKWALYEMVFTEVWLRLENFFRDHLWYFSTYIYPATMQQDYEQKTDIMWLFKLNWNFEEYYDIPIQLTVGKMARKLTRVARFLFKWLKYEKVWIRKRKYYIEKPFVILKVNGRFWWLSLNGVLCDSYDAWLKTHNIRETQHISWDRFPLFIDNLSNDDYFEANVIILALHIISFCITRKYSFSDEHIIRSHGPWYENIYRRFWWTVVSINWGLIQKSIELSWITIWWVIFDNLEIKCEKIERVFDEKHPKNKNRHIHRIFFRVSYKQNWVISNIWEIVIYR